MLPFFNRQRHYCYRQWKKVLITISSLAPLGYAQAVMPDYDALIIQARAGDIAGASTWLSQQSLQRRLTVNEVADWIQIQGWAGNDEQVIEIWQRYHPAMTLPERAVSTVARSYRNLHQWPESLALWRDVLERSPDNDDARSGLIMTLADAGLAEQALYLASQRVKREPSAAHWRELAWVQNAAGLTWDAQVSLQQASAATPHDTALRHEYSAVLASNRVNRAALDIATQGNVPPDVLRQRLASAAAERVRMALLPSATEQERFVVADRALADYDQLLNQWRSLPEAQSDYQRARIDRLGALLARYRMQEVVAEYEALEQARVSVPPYALRWVASAYLYLKAPDKAEKLYRSTADDALDMPDYANLFYSLSENEQIPQAQHQVDKRSALTPYLRHIYGSPLPQPNDDWLEIRQLSVQSLLLHDDLPQAQQFATHLADTAPGNQGLRIDLASIYLMRGWPYRAEKEMKRVESLEPRNSYLEEQQALTALALQEWRQADLLADDVITRFPESLSAQRVDRLRRVHHLSELRIEGSRGIKSDSPVEGSRDVDIDVALYSPPIADNWRLFSSFAFNRGEFEEGKAVNRRVRGGVEFTNRGNWLEMEVSGQGYGQGNKMGARLSGWHDFNDRWRLGGNVERLMNRTPLRALKNNVTANGAEVYARWRESERREWQMSFSQGWFSDGNRQFDYVLEGKERLYSSSYLTVDFTPSVSVGHSRESDVPYYSPQRDIAVLPAVTLDHLMYRHYQTEWHQEVTAGVGRYWQKQASAGAITSLGYGQRVRWNDVLDTGVRVEWMKRPYDGVREQNLSLSFDLNYRF